MARQNINKGTAANDRTGDTLRQAAEKINENFIELYQHLGGDSDQLSSLLSVTSTAVTLDGSLIYAAESLDSSGGTGNAASLVKPLTVFTNSDAQSFTLANASSVGHSKKFITTGAGTATITPSSFANGTSLNLAQNGACELIWSGSNWHLFSDIDSASALTITP